MRSNWLAFDTIQYHLQRFDMANNFPKQKPLMNMLDYAGFGPSTTTNVSLLPVETLASFNSSAVLGLSLVSMLTDSLLLNNFTKQGWLIQGPEMLKIIGNYSWHFYIRANVDYIGIAINDPVEAIYTHSKADPNHNKYDGNLNYTMTFAANSTPPVNVFWSLVAYSSATRQLMNNTLWRFSLSSLKDSFYVNPDGSITVYIGSVPPAGSDPNKLANWLPVGPEIFYLVCRMYGPMEPVLQGKYLLPGVFLAGPY